MKYRAKRTITMPDQPHPIGARPHDRPPAETRTVITRMRRSLWMLAGTVLVILGLVGALIPVLPTTPFLLLAAACYARSSQHLHQWLFQNQLFGKYLRRYYQGEGLPLGTKIAIWVALWVGIGLSVWFVPDHLGWARVLLIGIGLGVTAHILYIKTWLGPQGHRSTFPTPRDDNHA